MSPSNPPLAAFLVAPASATPRASVAADKGAKKVARPFAMNQHPGLLKQGDLWAIKERARSMSFFDARQYCMRLDHRRHLGVQGWRLPTRDEIARWSQVVGVRHGKYWSDELSAGKAMVVALPSKRSFRARLRRRFIRPFCVAPRD